MGGAGRLGHVRAECAAQPAPRAARRSDEPRGSGRMDTTDARPSATATDIGMIPGDTTIAGIVATHARYRPDHVAVVGEPHRLTWREFHRRTNRVANAFVELGIAKGDKIATLLANLLELLEVYWAAAKIGAVVVPLSPLLRGRGLSTLLNDADVALVVTETANADFLDEVRGDVGVPAERYLLIDGRRKGYGDYHALAAGAPESEPPRVEIRADDPY